MDGGGLEERRVEGVRGGVCKESSVLQSNSHEKPVRMKRTRVPFYLMHTNPI